MSHILEKRLLRSTKERRIPYKIHQTFKTNRMPPAMFAAANSYVTQNPDYDYFFYDDDDIVAVLEAYDCSGLAFTKEELRKAYEAMNTGAGKADLFRYVIVYQEGGCYFDIDTVCLKPLDTFLDEEDELVSGIGDRGDLHQWGMIYAQRHPFVKKALENSVYNILNRRFVAGYRNLEGLTGPPCLDISIKEVLQLPLHVRFTSGIYTIKGHRFHVLNGDFFGGAIQFKYEGYRDDLRAMNIAYWQEKPIFK
jgi:mannosyltransferase OCH1-like enzyme